MVTRHIEYSREEDYFITRYAGFTLKLYDGYYDDLPVVVSSYLERYVIREGDIIIDAGAYIGAFTLLAAKLAGDKGKVLAFEPDKDNFRKLMNNIRLNKAGNVAAINKGLWSKDTTLEFNNASSGESSVLFDSDNAQQAVSVPGVALDSELKRLNVRRVDFIKMDIEGAEIEALKGCRRILKANDCALAIAAYHIVECSQTCDRVRMILMESGYNTEVLSPREHLTICAYKHR